MLNRRCLVNLLTVGLVGVFLAIAGPAWAGEGGEIYECPPGWICDGQMDHLECYRIIGGSAPKEVVSTFNQFADETVRVLHAELLCAPTQKVRRNGNDGGDLTPDYGNGPVVRPHFMCYRLQGAPPENETVTVFNQFESYSVVQVQSRELLCVPTQKFVGAPE